MLKNVENLFLPSLYVIFYQYIVSFKSFTFSSNRFVKHSFLFCHLPFAICFHSFFRKSCSDFMLQNSPFWFHWNLQNKDLGTKKSTNIMIWPVFTDSSRGYLRFMWSHSTGAFACKWTTRYSNIISEYSTSYEGHVNILQHTQNG